MFVILKVNFKSKYLIISKRNLDIHRYCLKFESNKNIKPLNATVLLAVISDHGPVRLYSISFNFSIYVLKKICIPNLCRINIKICVRWSTQITFKTLAISISSQKQSLSTASLNSCKTNLFWSLHFQHLPIFNIFTYLDR